MNQPEYVFLGLGSNLGNRLGYLRQAITGIHQSPYGLVRKVSSVYETEPVGNENQVWFLNAVIAIEWSASAGALLEYIRTIEHRLGRERKQRWGPRTADIDIICFGGVIISEPDLQVPHPRLKERRFVLEPLTELAPELKYPGTGISMKQALRDCPDTHKVRKIADPSELWSISS